MKKGFNPKIDKTFRFRDVKWKPIMRVKDNTTEFTEIHRIVGPLCLEDSAKIDFNDETRPNFGICPICERVYNLKFDQNSFRELAHRAYQASLDNNLETISLDDPIQPLKAREEDDSYWVEVKLGHSKDGRKIAIVYIGDKTRGTKAQNFIDIDNEQLRSDRADAKPHEIVSKIEVEFLNSKHTITKK